MACNHPTLRFHSGGYFIECAACKEWWAAVKNAHSPNQEYDYSRGNGGLYAQDERASMANALALLTEIAPMLTDAMCDAADSPSTDPSVIEHFEEVRRWVATTLRPPQPRSPSADDAIREQ